MKKPPPKPLTFVPPMLAKRARQLPTGPDWQYELKWDGYRMQALKSGDQVRLLSRRGTDYTRRFAKVAAAVAEINAQAAILDGEVVAIDQKGRPCFQVLQGSDEGASGCRIVYYVFDLLHLDGVDLTLQPLRERRAQLAKVVKGCELVLFSQPLPGSAEAVTRAVQEHGLEGVVAKRAHSIYRPGKRSDTWQKLPLKQSSEFIIGRYRPLGRNFEVLLVGRFDRRRFTFAGKVHQGLTPGLRRDIFRVIGNLATAACPFCDLPSATPGRFGEGITAKEMDSYVWLRPEIVAETKFTEWTRAGMLRHAEFVALKR